MPGRYGPVMLCRGRLAEDVYINPCRHCAKKPEPSSSGLMGCATGVVVFFGAVFAAHTGQLAFLVLPMVGCCIAMPLLRMRERSTKEDGR